MQDKPDFRTRHQLVTGMMDSMGSALVEDVLKASFFHVPRCVLRCCTDVLFEVLALDRDVSNPLYYFRIQKGSPSTTNVVLLVLLSDFQFVA